MASYTLSITSPDKSKQSVQVTQGRVIIGREEADVIIDDPRCSSQHAELLFDGQSVQLRDLSSTNGTWHRGRRVESLTWSLGEVISIGKFSLSLEAVEQATGPGRTQLAGHTGMARASNDETTLSLPRSALLKLTRDARLWIPAAALLLLVVGVVVSKSLPPKAKPVENKQEAVTDYAVPEANLLVATVGESKPGAQRQGFIRPARVRVGPNHAGGVSVGIMEDSVQGAGEQWRAATWLAAFNASRANGKQLGEQEFNVHVHGFIEGPSAGMLMTVAMIALMRGTRIPEDVTITGTINPDGTTGPVGCIVEKLMAAKKHGVQRFGFPIGTSQQPSCNKVEGSDTQPDLVQRAKDLGIHARELKSIEDAYEFATGVPLGAMDRPVSESELDVLPETKQMLSIKMESWQAKTRRELVSLSDAKTLNLAQQMFARANADRSNDYLAAALRGYADTCVTLALGNRMTVLGKNFDGKNLDKSLRTAEHDLVVFGEELGLKVRPSGRAGQLNAAYAFYTYANTWALMRTAQQLRELSKSLSGPAAADTLRRVAIYLELTHFYLDYARDVQDLARDEGTTPALTDAELEQIVASYRAAAHASISAFDSLVVDGLAKIRNISPDQARALWAYVDLDYAMASNALELADGPAPTPAKQLQRLAASSYAYLAAAKVLNTWNSLEAICGSGGGAKRPELVMSNEEQVCASVTIPNRKALSEQLEYARSHARLAAGSAKHKSFIPAGARLAYEQAAARREGADSDKIDALLSYWESALWSDLAAAKLQSAPP